MISVNKVKRGLIQKIFFKKVAIYSNSDARGNSSPPLNIFLGLIKKKNLKIKKNRN